MQSRMEKYFEDDSINQEMPKRSRTKKNQDLYKEVSKLELEDFDLNSNVSIIGDNSANINLDEIKDILDKKYHETPKKKSFGDSEETLTRLKLDETREYDINSILEKAKEKKEVNYEEDRLKKIRNTQYDILKSLDIMTDEEEIEEKKPITPSKPNRPKETKEESERKLKELIDTITAKELIKQEENLNIEGELDPLDILSDLKGDDENTRVMGMLSEQLKEAEEENQRALASMSSKRIEDTLGIENPDDEEDNDETIDEPEQAEEPKTSSKPKELTEEEIIKKTLALKEFDKEIEEEMQRREEEHKKSQNKESNMENTNTFTNTMSFTQSDFDDFIDLKEDMQITKVIVKILIVIIIIVFVLGIIALANNYLGLGLF